MKFKLIQVPRRPDWPLWSVVIVCAWLALVGGSAWWSARSGQELQLCVFRRVTSVPCPTCGSTRGCLSVIAGRPLLAWRYNPLVFTVLLLAAGAMALRVTCGKAVRLEMSGGARKIAWVLVIAAVLANWAYVIVFVGDRVF